MQPDPRLSVHALILKANFTRKEIRILTGSSSLEEPNRTGTLLVYPTTATPAVITTATPVCDDSVDTMVLTGGSSEKRECWIALDFLCGEGGVLQPRRSFSVTAATIS